MKKTAKVEITQYDIATIEALHDLLLDNGYNYDFITLKNARALTKKMYDTINNEATDEKDS